MRLLRLTGIALLVAIAALRFVHHRPAAPHENVRPLAIPLNKQAAIATSGLTVTSLSGSGLPAKGTAQEKLEVLRGFYRLAPDHRFLAAFPRIDSVLGGAALSDEAATASFSQGRWEIRYKGEYVGLLPDIPDFPDYMKLLSEWIRFSVKRAPLTLVDDAPFKPDPDLFLRDGLFQALDACGRQWKGGTRSRPCLAFAAHAYGALLQQSLGVLDAFEALDSDPIAFLALAEMLTNAPLVKEEARIAYELGYTAHARRLAAGLPPDDPLAEYILHRRDALQAAMQPVTMPEETRVLALLDLGRRQKTNEFMTLLQRRTSYDDPVAFVRSGLVFPVMKGEMWLGDFALTARTAGMLQFLALSAVGRVDAALHADAMKRALEHVLLASDSAVPQVAAASALAVLSVTQKDEVARFEQDDDRQAARYDTPLLDGRFVRAFNESFFYGGVYQEAEFLLESLGSIDDAKQMLERFPPKSGAFQDEFRQWYEDQIDTTLGKISVERWQRPEGCGNCRSLWLVS